MILAGALWLRWDGWSRPVNEDEAYFYLEPSILFQNPAMQATRASASAYFTSYTMFKFVGLLRATGHIELVRLPFLLIGLMGIWFGWKLGRAAGGWLMAFVFALVLALWPFKAYSDVEIRYYCLMLSLPVGELWLLERWRRRPAWPGFLSATAVTAFAALVQVMSLILVAAPWIYAAWIAFESRRQFRARRFAVRYAAQVLALLLASAALVCFNRGPAWFNERFGLRIDVTENPEITRAREEGRLFGPKIERGAPDVPSPLKALAWSGAAIGNSLAGRNAPRLFGLQETPPFFWTLFTGLGGRGDFVPGDWANVALLLALLLGSAALARRSPPLVVSAWAILLANAMLIDLNRHLYMVAMRYYALGGLMVVLLAAAGIGWLLQVALWPARCIGRRRHASATVAAALVIGIVSFAALERPVRARTGYFIQDWKGLYRLGAARFPQGAYFIGMAAPSQQLYNDLAVARSSEESPADYWASPRRNRVEEAYEHPGWTDMALLEQLNPFAGLVTFMPEYWRGDFFPLYRYKTMLPQEPIRLFGVRGRLAPLGRMFFVCRGRATMPLLPRFSVNGPVSRLDCHFEVPGVYEILVGESRSAKLTSLKVDGRTLPFDVIERREPWALPENLDTRWCDPAESGHNPVFLAPARLCRARFSSPVYFGTTQTLELAWSDRLTTSVPVIDLRLVEGEWIPASKSISAGGARAWRDGSAFYFNVPIRIEKPDKPILDATLYLDGPGAGVIAKRPHHILLRMRGINQGDAVCGDPLRIPNDVARRFVGKPLRLGLALSDAVETSGRAALAPETIIAPNRRLGAGLFLAGYYQFVERDGRIEVMVGKDP
ncbi:MAG: hypothetical protein ABFD69_02715 [Candidatus Sumerlaeia bacterium]